MVLDGVNIDEKGEHRSIAAFDTMTGRQLWTRPQESPGTNTIIQVDAPGRVLLIGQGNEQEQGMRFRLPEMESLGLTRWPIAIAPGVSLYSSDESLSVGKERHYVLQEDGNDMPLLRLRANGLRLDPGKFRVCR